MSKKIAVILSGCGVFDGAEIHESVLCLLRLDQAHAEVHCFAPDMPQHHVVNHITGESMAEERNVLVESARIARGHIKPLTELNPADFSGLIIPGGFGVAKNLCDFALKGAEFSIQPDVKKTIQGFAALSKPIGLVCISPAMAGKLFADGVKCTIGNDAQTAAIIEQTGASHVTCAVTDIVVDDKHKLVTTPAYMLAGHITEAQEGIFKLVDKVLEMA